MARKTPALLPFLCCLLAVIAALSIADRFCESDDDCNIEEPTCTKIGICVDCSSNGVDSPIVMEDFTMANLSLNSFEENGDGGGESKCDQNWHYNSDPVVALSTGWYADGLRCMRTILIKSPITEESIEATVVDECDSTKGCDDEHAFQAPCHTNMVDASQAVWDALGLNIANNGKEQVMWRMA